MDIVEKALSVRNNLVQCSVNPIDYSLGIVPPYIGSGDIKLIILGQDPTVRNAAQRAKIKRTLNLDNEKGALRLYVERICASLGLSLDNVYATNIYKYFYTVPPADTLGVLSLHKLPNIALLKEELSLFGECPVVTLGEPVLQLLCGDKQKVRYFWGYDDALFHHIAAEDNVLQRPLFVFPHQPSMRKRFYRDNLDAYLKYMREFL